MAKTKEVYQEIKTALEEFYLECRDLQQAGILDNHGTFIDTSYTRSADATAVTSGEMHAILHVIQQIRAYWVEHKILDEHTWLLREYADLAEDADKFIHGTWGKQGVNEFKERVAAFREAAKRYTALFQQAHDHNPQKIHDLYCDYLAKYFSAYRDYIQRQEAYRTHVEGIRTALQQHEISIDPSGKIIAEVGLLTAETMKHAAEALNHWLKEAATTLELHYPAELFEPPSRIGGAASAIPSRLL